ncbi:MAG: hypothetical protein U9N59_05505 [Campylobacterota bacterium]|nr:hypothetical protein [Campylobacterota bacterium]
MQNYTLNIKNLLILTLISISIVYYIFLTPTVILEIIKDQYIFIGIILILSISLLYFKIKLKNLQLISYIPNTDNVPLKSTLIFFVIFQAIDFYYEDGFIGMISQWLIYWIFGVLAWALTNNINLYKNFKFYKYETLEEHRL